MDDSSKPPYNQIIEYQNLVLSYEALDEEIDNLIMKYGGMSENIPSEEFAHYRKLAHTRDEIYSAMREMEQALEITPPPSMDEGSHDS